MAEEEKEVSYRWFEYSKMVWRKLAITDMSVTNLLGITHKLSELEIRSDIIPQLVFHKQVLLPGANVIKLLFTVILL